MLDPLVPLTLEFFVNPCCPLSTSSAALASGLAVVSRQVRPEDNPTAAGEDATLLMDLPDLPVDGVRMPLLTRA